MSGRIHGRVHTPAPTPAMLTTRELCEELRIEAHRIYSLVRAGKVSPFRIGSAYRFNREEIERVREALR